ncbi:MAG: transcriptional regulator [Nitrososphaerales archaeon]|nr:transcriptional regulator [Nitrososphaerales archaeon]
MEKDQAIGAIILIASILGIIIYGWLLFFIAPQLVLQISAFIAVVAILVILAWIGWTMATTPPPKPIETEVPTTMGSEQMSEESKK